MGDQVATMGAFLDKPITEKKTSKTSGNGLTATSSHMQGWRVSMEDAHIQMFGLGQHRDINLFGVFDGHGGSYAAQFTAAKLAENILNTSQWNDSEVMAVETLGEALRQAALDLDLRDEPPVRSGEDHSGTTAVFGLVTSTHIIIANIGDSRSVLGTGGRTVPMSFDHKPNNTTEEKRIVEAGGLVSLKRVNGDLAVSRALGDFSYKQCSHLPAVAQQVSPEADLTVMERTAEDEFLILACDGIWDVMTNEQSTQYFREALQNGSSEKACEDLLDECLLKQSRDNMTVILVTL